MRRTFKWIGIVLGGLIGLVLLALGIVYIISSAELGTEYEITAETIAIPTDSASLAHGQHRVRAISKCADCHSENLGGKVFIDEFPFGKIIAPNLTSGKGGIGTTYTDQDWVRAIRYGVNREKKGLLFMPSNEYWHNSDAELGEIIAYVKSLPPVDNELEESSVGPLGRVLYVTGQLPLVPVELIDLTAQRAAVPSEGATAEYGKHLVTVSGCAGCHKEDLSGGKMPGTPPDWPAPSNLTPHPHGLGSYTEADFFTALRQGKKKTGEQMDPLYMPWKATALMKDDEIRAVWAYLRTVPPKETAK